jgi:hypothetical protein
MNDLTQQNTALSAGTKVAESREVALIQASMLMAFKNPRNVNQCFINIIDACKRVTLAEQAEYAYSKGGKLVTGATIRLAEVLAQNYGNMNVGIEVLNQTEDRTEAVAFAMDMQTNYVVRQSFIVPHVRTTGKGDNKKTYRLTDEREIRELVMNMGSRQLRGCILRVIPGDITEAAQLQCKKTQENSDIPLKEQIRKLVVAFDDIGIKVEHLEKRLGHNLDATIVTEIVTLRGIYKSIKDGMAAREDFFDIGKEKAQESKEKLDELLKTKSLAPLVGTEHNPETGEVA